MICLVVCTSYLAGCSFFGGTSQQLKINSEPPGATVLVNGSQIGTTPLQYDAPRRGELRIDVQKPGYQTSSRATSRKLSSVGFVDVIGGAMFLLPLLGLIAPGAWEQDPSIFNLSLEPEIGSAPTTAP
ncbi:MAG: PEGA domain-containing protein [Nitrospiraceae bacterium]